MAARSSHRRKGQARKPAATIDCEGDDHWDIDDEDEDEEEDDSHLSQTNRKLASIQLITNVVKHPNAEALSIAEVLGWSVIVRLDEVQTGDQVVFCEIDSMLPTLAEWLPPAIRTRIGDTASAENFFRVKTIRLRDLPSQGLIVPMSLLPSTFSDLPVGTNVTAELGIKKYQPRAVRWRAPRDGLDRKSRVKQARRGFPTHLISKTDETRIQSAPWLLNNSSVDDATADATQTTAAASSTDDSNDTNTNTNTNTNTSTNTNNNRAPLPYYITLKMDGTSSTFVLDEDKSTLLVCSRNFVVNEPRAFPVKEGTTPPSYPIAEYTQFFKAEDDEHRYEYCVYNFAARKYALQRRLAALGEDYALQGEIVGPRIQKNLLNARTVELYIFNVVKTAPVKTLLSYTESVKLLERLNDIEPDAAKLQMVPLIEMGDVLPFRDIAELVQHSKGFYPGTKNHREGLVIRFFDPETQAVRRSFKVINVDYLLKHD